MFIANATNVYPKAEHPRSVSMSVAVIFGLSAVLWGVIVLGGWGLYRIV